MWVIWLLFHCWCHQGDAAVVTWLRIAGCWSPGPSHVPPVCAEENIRHQKDMALFLDLAKSLWFAAYVSEDSPESGENHLGKFRSWWDKPWMRQFDSVTPKALESWSEL